MNFNIISHQSECNPLVGARLEPFQSLVIEQKKKYTGLRLSMPREKGGNVHKKLKSFIKMLIMISKKY